MKKQSNPMPPEGVRKPEPPPAPPAPRVAGHSWAPPPPPSKRNELEVDIDLLHAAIEARLVHLMPTWFDVRSMMVDIDHLVALNRAAVACDCK